MRQSTASCPQEETRRRRPQLPYDWGHLDHERVSHERPGERERIAFHVHEFDHGCYGQHCPEADRLYAVWHTALAKSQPVRHG
jgi:hypothetical protein